MEGTGSQLVAAAKAASHGMAQVAAAKPNETVLNTDARTLRGTARILAALTDEFVQHGERLARMEAKMQRIANLQIRGGTDLVSRGEWRCIVEELQAIAQDALVPGSAVPSPREQKARD